MDWKYLFTSFEGRINRAKLWAGVGVLVVVGIAAALLDLMLGTYSFVGGTGLISFFATLASIYFAVALYAKRWHDRDKSGWWTLIGLVPVIGFIWMIVELGILEGTRGPNSYGPDPLA